jgi:geranylgeranyl reductase family protein
MKEVRKTYDVIIIGGGPAGLYTAKILGEAGLDILVLEEKEEVGKNILCTGIVSKELFEEFDISKDSIIREIRTVKLISPFGTSILYTHSSPFAYVIDREKFNTALFIDAKSKGVEFRFSHKVFDINILKNKVEVITQNLKDFQIEKFEGKMIILATGFRIRLCKKLGLDYPVKFLKGAQKRVKLKEDFVTIITGSSISKGGFGWIVPEKENFARVGLITEGSPREGFKNLVKNYLFTENLEEVEYKPIAQGLVSKTFGERIISVGECAGQVKTTTGGGIYFGLICAEIAGEEVLKAFKNGDFSSERLSSYNKKWKSKIGNEIKRGYFLRKMWGRLTDEQIEKLFTMVKSDGFMDYISRKLKFDWHSLTLIKLLQRKEIREVFFQFFNFY